MTDLYAALLSWAIQLSGYPTPTVLPIVAMVSHSELERLACAGRTCRVLGWYAGGDTVYLDERMDVRRTFDSSILVHEFVHYLQGASGRYSVHYDCAESIALEREAYGVQQSYLVAYGDYRPIQAMHAAGCGE